MECGPVSTSESDESCTGSTIYKNTKRSSKTSKKQFEKLILFMKSHSDFTRRKPDDQLKMDWEVLCGELNSMGHTVHSTKEWRKIWTNYKGKKKQKLSASRTPVVQPQTDFELLVLNDVSTKNQSTLPTDVQSSSHSLTDQHGDIVTQSSLIRSDGMSNTSRKRSITSSVEAPRKIPHLDQTSDLAVTVDNVYFEDITVEDVGIVVTNSNEGIKIQSEFSHERKLDVIIQNQSILIQKQDEIISELKISNQLLQEIARDKI